MTAELDEGGSPRKQIRIQVVHDECNSVFIGSDEYFHEDESFQFCFDQHESEYLEDYDDDLRDGSEANQQADPDLTAAKEQLIFPDTGHGEPQLDAARLQELDALADRIEIERLIGLGVLLPPDDLLSNSQVRPAPALCKRGERRRWKDARCICDVRGMSQESLRGRRSGKICIALQARM